jgi:hypothetical protein
MAIRIHISDYDTSEAYDAVFSMTSTETFVMGIACTLLEGKTVPDNHRVAVWNPYLVEKTIWVLEDRSRFDLRPFPELLDWARTLEAVRRECLKLILI